MRSGILVTLAAVAAASWAMAAGGEPGGSGWRAEAGLPAGVELAGGVRHSMEDEVVRRIASAEFEVLFSAGALESEAIVDALAAAFRARRYVAGAAGRSGPGAERLSAAGVPVALVAPSDGRAYAATYLVLDRAVVVTGLLAWEGAALAGSEGLALIVEEPTLAQAYAGHLRSVLLRPGTRLISP